MRKTILALLLFTLSAWSAGSASPGDVDEIRSLRLENNRAIASRNVELMRHAWSQSIRLIEGDGIIFTGSGPLAASYASIEFKDASFVAYVRRPITITIGADGRSAAEYGTWTAVYKTPKRDRSGRYLASWRKFGRDWKIIYEAYVSLGLAAQASPPKL
ncbi:MAG TPA: nuclear transport factor 2 family protein [Candidatus Baltobacteraceae bacterium]|nr:nuclear transport factor 2 family protein [Candidatus Baltobacteraceae bacterium]